MTTPEKIEQSPVKVPLYQHSSETARSKEQAGGEVPTSDYVGRTPGSNVVRR